MTGFSEARLSELYDQGLTDTEIADAVPCSRHVVYRWRRRTGRAAHQQGGRRIVARSGEQVEKEYIASISEDDGWPGILPRPIQVNIPEPNLPKPQRETYISIHYGDVHFPFQDDAALEVLYQITADLCPDEVNCHGDLADCTTISKYEKDPQHRIELQDELKQVAKHLGMMAALSPFATRRWLLGNHEDRLRRLIWDMAASVPAQQLVRLPNVWEQLEWGRLVGAESAGWEVHTGKVVQFDKLVLKHGDVVRQQSAYSARAELERYQKSGISGHTHRRGVYEKRDLNGAHAWWEHGCLCDLNPSYVSDPNWQQGFLVVTWSATHDRYGVEEVRIHDGTAIFRGKTYGRTE